MTPRLPSAICCALGILHDALVAVVCYDVPKGGDAMIAIKYFMFIGLELFVVVLLAAVLIKLLRD